MTDVEVRVSRIEGLGLFAIRAFGARERLVAIHAVREVTREAPLREDLGERIVHCAYPDGKVVLIAFPERHLNHSCEPNAYERFDGARSELVALRDIAAGEEITIDYNINITNGSAWPCRCGSTRCSGVVVGDFFRLPADRQRAYRPLLAEWFIRRNRERVEALDSSGARSDRPAR